MASPVLHLQAELCLLEMVGGSVAPVPRTEPPVVTPPRGQQPLGARGAEAAGWGSWDQPPQEDGAVS